MLFTSDIFLFQFLPAVFISYFICEWLGFNKSKIILLLLSSLFFYAWWKLQFLPILLISIIFNYSVGYCIDASSRHKRAILMAGVTGNLALLGYFKYADFFIANASIFTSWPLLHVALPLGISFFTFTQIAYLADCAEGLRGDHGPIEYALFVTFFPHLIAGPIIHHADIIPQLRRAAVTEASDVTIGLCIFIMGLAKKIIFADQLAPIADAVFDSADAGTTITQTTAWIGALAYTFQIYFDFSGYSDMAVGLARMFGVKFPWNFNSPYKACSIIDFWRRWHMTLSKWLLDYLYIPLGGNRKGRGRRYVNLLITMLLGGLWHGAHWNFVIWGGLHGAFLALTHLAGEVIGRPRQPLLTAGFNILGWITTFLFVVLTWVFFRSHTTKGAVHLLVTMFTWPSSLHTQPVPITSLNYTFALLVVSFAVAIFSFNSITFMRAIENHEVPPILVGGLIGMLAFLIMVARMTIDASPFIYFNF